MSLFSRRHTTASFLQKYNQRPLTTPYPIFGFSWLRGATSIDRFALLVQLRGRLSASRLPTYRKLLSMLTAPLYINYDSQLIRIQRYTYIVKASTDSLLLPFYTFLGIAIPSTSSAIFTELATGNGRAFS